MLTPCFQKAVTNSVSGLVWYQKIIEFVYKQLVLLLNGNPMLPESSDTQHVRVGMGLAQHGS